jgi:nucleotide-binding universal stress UspA family protein
MDETSGQPHEGGVGLAASGGQIIVGIDSSPASNTAVDWAAAEADSRHASLHLVHTWSWQHLAPWSTEADRMVVSDLEHAGRNMVNHARAVARRAYPGLEVTTEVCEGPAARVLNELGREAAMIVVGTHHLHPLGRTVLGSASSGVVAHSTCPVVVVSKAPRAAASTNEVVVGIAATPDDQRVLAFAFEYARRHGMPLRAVFAWHPDGLADTHLRPPDRALRWLGESLAGWRIEYPDVEVEAVVRRGHPVVVLVEAARAQDLIVLGRRAHHVHAGMQLGSVSLGVLHHATSSVAVVPAPPD